MHLRILLFYLLLAVAGAAAWILGGRPERQVAAMLVAATISSKLVAWPLYGHFAEFETALSVIDVILLAGLLAVALTSDRYWPLWLTPLHAYTVIAHLGRWITPDTFVAVYLSNSALMADPGLILLIIASWRHYRRSRPPRAPMK
jgi:hypothetical protein